MGILEIPQKNLSKADSSGFFWEISHQWKYLILIWSAPSLHHQTHCAHAYWLLNAHWLLCTTGIIWSKFHQKLSSLSHKKLDGTGSTRTLYMQILERAMICFHFRIWIMMLTVRAVCKLYNSLSWCCINTGRITLFLCIFELLHILLIMFNLGCHCWQCRLLHHCLYVSPATHADSLPTYN